MAWKKNRDLVGMMVNPRSKIEEGSLGWQRYCLVGRTYVLLETQFFFSKMDSPDSYTH